MQLKNIVPVDLTRNMDIEIWSDVRCPFCYIGKHKFEKALRDFEHKDKIKVTWRSFELDPTLETMPDIDAMDHLSEMKGMDRAQIDQMTDHIMQAAKEVGLNFDFKRSVVANSFNAHRLIQFAQSRGLGNEIEEVLFKAHFTEGKNIDDPEELQQIGEEVGLERDEVAKVMKSDDFADHVNDDQKKAQTLGIRGVPFFVFDGKYALSGAQSPEIFLQALSQSYGEFAKNNESISGADGVSCTVDGICD